MLGIVLELMVVQILVQMLEQVLGKRIELSENSILVFDRSLLNLVDDKDRLS